MKPEFKVTITHSAVDTDYEKRVFSQIQVKRPESAVSSAVLYANNYKSQLYDSQISKFDVVKVYLRKTADDSYTQVFGGRVRQLVPMVGVPNGLKVMCKGYGQALFDTHVNIDYGTESSVHSARNTIQLILQHAVDYYVNKSLGTAADTGYLLDRTNIENLTPATKIAYINNPYRRCGDLFNLVCQLGTVIHATNVGPHYFVDVDKKVRLKTVGSNTQTPNWPQWYSTDAAGSTFEEGLDFHNAQLLDRSDEFANKILFLTDFRRPSYDYWTEDTGGVGLWTNDSLKTLTMSVAQNIVGSHSLRLESNGAAFGYAYYPAIDANWDVTKWGSERTIPKLSFYYWKDANINEGTTFVYMSNNDTARKTDYFYTNFSNWHTDPDSTWVHVSIPIGPYWATDDENRLFRWLNAGAALDWTDIDTIEFVVGGAGGDALLYIDDLHFSGKIIREAKNSTSITANKEIQKVLISRTAMDDTCLASDDSGAAARIAYAELLRRQKLPKSITFTTRLREDLLPGVEIHVHAFKTASGAFEFDSDCRVLLAQHSISEAGAITTVTATDDLYNSFPLNSANQYDLLTEYLLLNNREAADIRGGAGVDLLINPLVVDYP